MCEGQRTIRIFFFIEILKEYIAEYTVVVVVFKHFIFREKGKEGEREGEKHQCVRGTSMSCLSCAPNQGPWPVTQACALTGN